MYACIYLFIRDAVVIYVFIRDAVVIYLFIRDAVVIYLFIRDAVVQVRCADVYLDGTTLFLIRYMQPFEYQSLQL